MSRLRAVLLGMTLTAAPLCVGCGGRQTDPKESLNQQANAKVEAMKQLAEAVGRNAPADELNGIIESFVSNTLDVKGHPDDARQIIDTYNSRVKGKLRADQAAQVKGIVDGIDRELKR